MPLHHGLRSAAGASPADPYFSSTSLLLLGNGSNGGQNNTFVDSSTNNFTITRNGNTTQGSFSPFTGAGGSGYFDGSGDYLSVADNAAFDVGSGDWTIEAWIYINTAKNYNGIYGKRQAGAAHGLNLGIDISNTLTISVSNNSSSWALAGASLGGGYSANTWHHVAVTRSGTTITAWRNGVSTGTQTLSGSIYPATGYPALVGSMNDPSQEFNGYISNFRFVKGTALYSSTFTPPTSPLTAITNTSLLLNFTNASILDSTAKNDLETVGDAQVSTSVKKFGTGSLKFDGTGDYLTFPSSSNFSFGTGDFTIEGWVYRSDSNIRGIFQLCDTAGGLSGSNNLGLSIGSEVGQFWRIYANSTAYNSTATWSTSTWYHFALVKTSGTIKLYINGTSVISQSDSSTYSGTFLCVGGFYSTDYLMNGYIDDLRITKGVARYTSNFTPPVAQLPAR